jgi:hypothetical protein
VFSGAKKSAKRECAHHDSNRDERRAIDDRTSRAVALECEKGSDADQRPPTAVAARLDTLPRMQNAQWRYLCSRDLQDGIG